MRAKTAVVLGAEWGDEGKRDSGRRLMRRIEV